ncbi:MAG: pyruvate kinase [Acidobacteriota bacterium]|nr:pyruvate kinase [Acidobacteriota bacterium]
MGRIEANTLAGLDAVQIALGALAGKNATPGPAAAHGVDFVTGPALLTERANELLGPAVGRKVRIMVTMPREAGEQYTLTRDLVAAGMDVMRINCAHDDERVWMGMINNLRRAEREVGQSCKVLMDLGGPKLRTGLLGGGLRIIRWKTGKDRRGEVIAPKRIRIIGSAACNGEASAGPPEMGVYLSVDDSLLAAAEPDDHLDLHLPQGRIRKLRIVQKEDGFCWAECLHSGYGETGMQVTLRHKHKVKATGTIGELPGVEEPLTLMCGDKLVITGPDQAGSQAGRAHVVNDRSSVGEPARIPCTLPQVFPYVKKGDRIAFDDGKIDGIVREATAEHLMVEITRAGSGGSKLGADKTSNLPDSDLRLPALTEQDLANLDFVAAHADMVGLSFGRRAEDVLMLHRELEARGSHDTGIILKIENRQAFENLPRLLLAGLRFPHLGIMVARGDPAVELGFERLAEVQEEILWLCEAAHVLVVWATQVLETLAKTGQPSRAEVSDASMGVRAECVMLNKGPHIIEAVHFLDNILRRMQLHHQKKKRSLLRGLSVSEMAPDQPPVQTATGGKN